MARTAFARSSSLLIATLFAATPLVAVVPTALATAGDADNDGTPDSSDPCPYVNGSSCGLDGDLLVVDVGVPEVASALQAIGFHSCATGPSPCFDVLSPDGLNATTFAGYGAMIVGWGPQANASAASALANRASDIDPFVSGGGALLVFAGHDYDPSEWSWAPHYVDMTINATVHEPLHITTAGASHAALAGLADGDLSNWQNSTHLTFDAHPMDTLVEETDNGSAVTIAMDPHGSGCMLYSGQDAHHHGLPPDNTTAARVFFASAVNWASHCGTPTDTSVTHGASGGGGGGAPGVSVTPGHIPVGSSSIVTVNVTHPGGAPFDGAHVALCGPPVGGGCTADVVTDGLGTANVGLTPTSPGSLSVRVEGNDTGVSVAVDPSGGGAPPCFGGSVNFGFTVNFPGASAGPASGTLKGLLEGPGGCMSATGFGGDLAHGYHGGAGGMQPGSYNVTVFLDLDFDNAPDGGELQQTRSDVSATSIPSPQLTFNFTGFDGFDPANIPPGPCFGTGHFNGSVQLETGADHNVDVQAASGGCTHGTGFGSGNSSQFQNGTSFEFWGLNASADPWTLTAWIDVNGNGSFDAGEENDTAVASNETSGIHLLLHGEDAPFQSGGGGGCSGDGCGGGGCGPDGCGGPGGGGFGGCVADPGFTVSGTIFDPFGNVKPFANVNFQDDATGQGAGGTSADGSGHYSCTLAPGTYLLNACCDGQAFISFDLTENMTLDVDLSYNAHPPYHFPTQFYGGTVWGNATVGEGDDATPASGVRVSVYPSYAGGSCNEDFGTEGRPLRCYGEGVVQANGTFVITGLQAATFHMDADGSGVNLTRLHFENRVSFENVTADSEVTNDTGTIRFSPPSFINGTVRSDGDPVSGIRVSAFPQCFGPTPDPSACGTYGEDTTGPDGTYRIAVSAGTYGMEARTDFSYSGEPLTTERLNCFGGPGSDCVELGSGETETRDWNLSAGIVIQGHVQDTEGAPVQANINVQEHREGPCCGPTPPQNFWGQTRWDQPGNYSITVSPGTYDVRIEPYSWERPDLASYTEHDFVVNASRTLDVTLTTGGIIEGFVNDSDGNPAPYVNIVANTHVDRAPGDCCSMGQFAGYAFTGPDGHYRMSGLANGSYDLNFQPGFGSELQQKQENGVNATPGSTTQHDVVLLSGGKIAGYVYGPDGAPVRNAFVNAWWQVDFDPTPPPPPPSGGGGGGGGGPTGDLPACAPETPADVPVSGTWTHVGDGALDTTSLAFAALANGDEQMGTFDADAHTFAFAGLKACQYVLVAFNVDPTSGSEPKPDANGTLSFFPGADDSTPSFFAPLDFALPQDPPQLELRDAPSGGWAMLQDHGDGGSGGGGGFPGGGGPPPMSEPQSCSTGCWGSAQTDADGHYEIRGLGDGSFGMYVSPPFDRPELSSAQMDAFRDTLPVVALGETTEVDFTLASAGLVTGCLATSGGDPVRFAWISMWSPTSGGGGGASSGDDGCFTVFGMRAGTYEMDVQPPWFGDQSGLARKHISGIVVAEGETTHIQPDPIVMSDGITFSGRVVLASDHDHGIAGASVSVWQIQDQPGSFGGTGGFAWTDEDGNFTVRGLTEGRFGVNVWPQYGTGLTSFYEERTFNESVTDALIPLGSAGWINGTVVRASNGEPVVGAYVGAWSPHGGYAGAVTDENGDFNLTNLGPADDYSLDVWPPYTATDLAGYHTYGVTVVSDAAADLYGTGNNTIALSRGGALSGHVQDTDGTAVPNAFVNVGGRGTFGWGMTDEDGNFTVPGLNPDTGESLRVFVQPAFGTPLVGKEVRVAWAPDPDTGVTDAGTIELDAGKTLVGRITREDAPVQAYVYAWPSLDEHGHFSGPPSGGYALTDADGNYTIAGVIAGQTYDISVSPTDGSAGNFTDHAITIGSGDTTTYDVELGGGGDLPVHVSDTGGDVEGATVDCFNSVLHAGRTGTTDANGDVTLVGLPVGDYDCHVTAAGHTPNGAAGNVPDNAVTPLEIALDIATLNTVTGTYHNDTSADGFYVIAVPSGGTTDSTTTAFNLTSDPDDTGTGTFTLSGLVDDDYDVKVVDGSGTVVAQMTNVHIAANAATPALDLTFGDNVDG